MEHIDSRSIVWVRAQQALERSCPSGTPLFPGRPQHPADVAAGITGDGSVANLPPPGPIKFSTVWELAEVQEVLKGGEVYVVQVGSSFPSGKVPIKKTVDRDDVYLANAARFDGIPDMARLSHLSQPCLLQNIVVRYRAGRIYTNTGPLLVSINPFQRLDDLYSQQVLRSYQGANLSDVEPHVFCAAESARQCLKREGKSQSIVISGESGSGKTEAAKYIMGYLARSSGVGFGGGDAGEGGGQRTIEQSILLSNPITEALGNAKTVRNGNSSRFGKFLRIRMDRGGCIESAYIDHYLLEKPRVTNQPKGERNYHAFYQLCAGASETLRGQLKIKEAQEHRFTSQSGCLEVEGVDDAAEFHDTVGAMQDMGLSKDDEFALFRTLAGILHLGDVNFSVANDGSGVIDQSTSVDSMCECLGLTLDNARSALCQRKIKAGLDTLSVPKSKDEAVNSRDAVARVVYTRMFDWMIGMINVCLQGSAAGKAAKLPKAPSKEGELFVGLLDIFGFEIMDQNGFEQLCINYANEKLQGYFNEHMLQNEQKAYQEEGVSWCYVEFQDNTPVLALLDGKPEGLLPMLDDQCLFATASDATFLQVVAKTHVSNPDINFPRLRHSSFVVRHSAGSVEYEVAGFLDKNKDLLFSDLTDMMAASSLPFIRNMFQVVAVPMAPNKSGAAGRSKAAQHISVSAKFREQLTGLMKMLNETVPVFVRCIKPNQDKAPAHLDGPLVEHQLRCSGVLAAVKISQSGYPSRITYHECASRYKPLLPTQPMAGAEDQVVCFKILEVLGVAEGKYQMGKTRLFLRSGILARMEQLLANALSDSSCAVQRFMRRLCTTQVSSMSSSSVVVQRHVRCSLGRARYIDGRARWQACMLLQACCERTLMAERRKRREAAAVKLQKVVRGKQTRKRVEKAKIQQKTMREKWAAQSQQHPHQVPAVVETEVPCTSPQFLTPLAKSGLQQAGPSLAALMADSQDVGVQTEESAFVAEGMETEEEAGKVVGGELVLPSGERMTIDDIAALREENRRLQVVFEMSRRVSGLDASTGKGGGASLLDKLASTPAVKELECENIISVMKVKMAQFSAILDQARLGLRQGEEVVRLHDENEHLKSELHQLRQDKKSWRDMQEIVAIQSKQMVEMVDSRREVENLLLTSNMKRVTIEEELDNLKHWHELNVPKIKEDQARLAELEVEHAEVVEQLMTMKLRVAEMDSANCVLAAELSRLRRLTDGHHGSHHATPDKPLSTPRTFLGMPSPFGSAK